ncbi:hypothetical protein GRF61_14055 [Azoarcus sp. TTM-91]|uniref:hypothetical protein n=1 Tax=Azoarcus sp. TTM-91 TaxID=2691581 RepID=UPI00145D6232|nr:hypothetical protein [Azoarcus sp. TTM-91]NMG35568.1 hypothetical protein [Azoarcus sp. TTM-91]
MVEAGFWSLPAFYLQTSQKSKIDASATVVTAAYNAANKYLPQTVVADSDTGKLNLTTTFSFDGVGQRDPGQWSAHRCYRLCL